VGRAFPANGEAVLSLGLREQSSYYAIGSTVVALIFYMAKREVTFLSGTVAIRRL
jgi:hypothetical protein